VYRAIDEQGQVFGIYGSARRAADDATAFSRRAIEATGGAPSAVTIGCTAIYPPTLAARLPEIEHETGKPV